jgi:serine/threonine protein kinase
MTTIADRYELGDVLGVGGAATVHRATDLRLGRSVAVKVLDDRAARSTDPAARQRFLREASTAAQLTHPHLVTVFDAGADDEVLYLVMELVDGESLAQLLARSPQLPVDRAVSIATQLLDALTVVHAQGLVHRDVKPANVLVDRAGRVRLADFGIAKRFDDVESSLTTEATVVGTPTYLAPEQAAGKPIGPSTDVYLVGLVLFEMLTGARASAPAGQIDLTALGPDVPPNVASAIARATSPDPSARFADAMEMAVALQAGSPDVTAIMPATTATQVTPAPAGPIAPRTAPSHPGRRRWLVAALVGAAVLVLLAVLVDAGGTDVPSQIAPAVSTVPGTAAPTTPPPTPATTAAPVVVNPAPAPEAPSGDDDDGEGRGRGGGGNGNGKKDDDD